MFRDPVARWFEVARKSSNLTELGFESVHVNQLVGPVGRDALERTSFGLFSELVEVYREHSENIMAMLVIVIGESESIELSVPEPVRIADCWDGFTPPELYILDRRAQLSPYHVEEYKKPLDELEVECSFGSCYSYYRCHRQDDQDEFTRALYVEHYPQSSN